MPAYRSKPLPLAATWQVPVPVACDWHERWRLQETHHCHRQFFHSIRARPCAFEDLRQLVARREIEAAGGVGEFNTIAVDDGIAMGHDGMLYSLPSRDIIADSVEYMVNAHCADALVCISSCDKITPGMLMAAMRLNISGCVCLWRPDGLARPN